MALRGGEPPASARRRGRRRHWAPARRATATSRRSARRRRRRRRRRGPARRWAATPATTRGRASCASASDSSRSRCGASPSSNSDGERSLQYMVYYGSPSPKDRHNSTRHTPFSDQGPRIAECDGCRRSARSRAACFCGLTGVGPRTGAKTDDDEDGEDEEDDEDGEDGEDGENPPHGWTSHSMVAGGRQGSLRAPSAALAACGEVCAPV